MCGITVYIPFGKQSAEIIKKMNDSIRHRGPDDEGFLVFNSMEAKPEMYGGKDTPAQCYSSVYPYSPKLSLDTAKKFSFAMAHRRLAILDISPAGHQPMCSSDGQVWIVYNGEIYNFIELRQNLVEVGVQFHSNSDTEVILAAYQYWGREFLTKLNGMFAFAIYDNSKKTILIARDRFGIKPIYYWISNQGIAFASEIKQFTVLPGWKAEVNGQRAYDFLNWGVSDHTSETLFKGVYQLRGGEAMELSINSSTFNTLRAGEKISSYCWYHLQAHNFHGDVQTATQNFKNLLFDSVRLRLRADVPVGSCLSGGLDSSAIVCVVNSILRESSVAVAQKTFSACSEVERFDEKKFVDVVVQHTKVKAHYVYPSLESLFEENRKITWYQDEPYNTTSAYAQWNVFKIARQNGVVVVLDGQGADEQLAGYHRFFGTLFSTLFRQFQWLALLREIKATKKIHGYSEKLAAMQIMYPFLPQAAKYFLLKQLGRSSSNPSWLNLKALGVKPCDPFLKIGVKNETITDRSYWELTTTNLQKLLHWEDRNSMAHSIEARLPFLDYRLVETVMGMPDHLKISSGITKVVLREAMRGILPDQIRNRMDKLGFVTPEQVWVCEFNPDLFKKKIQEIVLKHNKIFNSDTIKITDDIIDGRRKYSSLPWRIISFGVWMEQFNVQCL